MVSQAQPCILSFSKPPSINISSPKRPTDSTRPASANVDYSAARYRHRPTCTLSEAALRMYRISSKRLRSTSSPSSRSSVDSCDEPTAPTHRKENLEFPAYAKRFKGEDSGEFCRADTVYCKRSSSNSDVESDAIPYHPSLSSFSLSTWAPRRAGRSPCQVSFLPTDFSASNPNAFPSTLSPAAKQKLSNEQKTLLYALVDCWMPNDN